LRVTLTRTIGAVVLIADVALVVFLARSRHGDPRPAIAGPVETVFAATRAGCDATDIPDLPVRALRDATGEIQVIVPHYVNRRLVGPDFDHLRHPCQAILGSKDDPDPARFSDRVWIASLFSLDGLHVTALLHEEYQGHRHPGRCPSGQYARCWYNAIASAVSADGGTSYREDTGRGAVVAASSRRYVPDSGPEGAFSPSNVVHSPRDRYFYAMFRYGEPWRGLHGSCVMRTRNPNDPASWRMWDGHRFAGRPHTPYGSDERTPMRTCQPVAARDIGELHETVTFNTARRRFLLIGMAEAAEHDEGSGWELFFSWSKDLVHWSPRRAVGGTALVAHAACGRNAFVYPSVIDRSSRSRVFDTSGSSFDLYLTRFNDPHCVRTGDRDLVKVRVRL
jgi:hypothetical protein